MTGMRREATRFVFHLGYSPSAIHK
jgi:hypothetical protein